MDSVIEVKKKVSMCEHGRQKCRCKECGGKSICEHNRRRIECKECGGSQFCEHGCRKSRCKECGGSSICEHGKRKEFCKDCGGSAFCNHGKLKRICHQCNGSGLCEHGRAKTSCKACGGSSICEHQRTKANCKDCNGSEICIHGNNKSCCKDCGYYYCSHGKIKKSCPDCDGSRLCKSRQPPYNTGCSTCGNRKLNGFCSHCFVNLFPDDPRALTIRKKSKELQVVAHLLNKYDGFIHDKPFYVDLEGGCCATKRRIDLRKLIHDTMLCIEIDENQHKSYIKTNEQSRYDDLFMDLSGKYIFIRYNPDKYIDKYNSNKNPYFETRMQVLEHMLDKHINRILNTENHDLVEIYHVFYDEI